MNIKLEHLDAAPLCTVCDGKMVKGEDGLYSCPKHGTAKMETDGVQLCPKCGKPMAKTSEGYECKNCAPAVKDAVDRVDYDPVDDADAEAMGYIQKFTKDANGFLRGKAAVTCAGVFSYTLPDGTIQREYRPKSEVLNADSLASLKLVPFTNDHPSVKVTPDNASSLSVGSLGDNIQTTSDTVYASIVVTSASAIKDAEENGKRALSCGYKCELEDTAGVWNGVAYDKIQRKIRYNHVSLVNKGRAGDSVVIKMDSGDIPIGTLLTNSPNKGTNMHKIRIDSAEVEVTEQVAKAFNALQAKHDTAEVSHKDAIAGMQAKLDAAEAQAKEAKEKLDGMPKAIESAIAGRLALVAKADSVGVAVKADQDDAAIMTAVVLKAFPKLDAEKLKAPAYLSASFDAAMVALEAVKPTADVAQSNAALGTPKLDGCGMPGEAKKRYEDEKKNAWKLGKSDK